jgi:uncharacterized membrane protein YqjE
MEEMPHEEDGVPATVARMIKTLRDVVENRVELFLLEHKEARVRFIDASLLAAAAIVCALMALVLITATVVVIFWDTHRVLVLVLFAAAYSATATLAFINLRSRLGRWQSFPATREQLKKDRECFKTKN